MNLNSISSTTTITCSSTRYAANSLNCRTIRRTEDRSLRENSAALHHYDYDVCHHFLHHGLFMLFSRFLECSVREEN